MISSGRITLLLLALVLPTQALRIESVKNAKHKGKGDWETSGRPFAADVLTNPQDNYKDRLANLEKMYEQVVDRHNKHSKKLMELSGQAQEWSLPTNRAQQERNGLAPYMKDVNGTYQPINFLPEGAEKPQKTPRDFVQKRAEAFTYYSEDADPKEKEESAEQAHARDKAERGNGKTAWKILADKNDDAEVIYKVNKYDGNITGTTLDVTACKLPQNSGVPGCTCEVQPYYACKTQGLECRDQFGICDPAATGSGSVVKALTSWQSWLAWWTHRATCNTRINPVNKLAECTNSFVADFEYDKKPCVCYESSISAPARWSYRHGWQNYTMTMLKGVKKEFDGMYKKAHIVEKSCAQRGFRFDKKVHPCLRHAYVSFRTEQCQASYRKWRAHLMVEKEEAQQKQNAKDGKRNYNEFVKEESLVNQELMEKIYSGSCNNGL